MCRRQPPSRSQHPEIAVVCLTASANSREIEALYAAGAAACLTKDQELDDIVDAVKNAAQRSQEVNLHRRKTPRSSSTRPRTSPTRRRATRTGASSALRQLRDRQLQGRRRPHGRAVLRAPAHVARAADDVAADPGDFLAVYEELGALRAHPLAAHLRESLRHVRERGHRGRGARRRPRARDRLGERIGRDRDARDRDPAAPRARHDRRGDRRLVERYLASTACSSQSTRSSSSRAAAASGAPGVCRAADEREADPLDPRRRGVPGEARPRQPQGVSGVHRRGEGEDRMCPAASGSRMRTRRNGS